MYAFCNNEKIACVLIEVLIRFNRQRQGCWIPNNLIDANSLRPKIIGIAKASNSGEKDGLAADCGGIDGPVKRNRDARLRIEAVEFIQKRHVQAVGGTSCTIGPWQMDQQ